MRPQISAAGRCVGTSAPHLNCRSGGVRASVASRCTCSCSPSWAAASLSSGVRRCSLEAHWPRCVGNTCAGAATGGGGGLPAVQPALQASAAHATFTCQLAWLAACPTLPPNPPSLVPGAPSAGPGHQTTPGCWPAAPTGAPAPLLPAGEQGGTLRSVGVQQGRQRTRRVEARLTQGTEHAARHGWQAGAASLPAGWPRECRGPRHRL